MVPGRASVSLRTLHSHPVGAKGFKMRVLRQSSRHEMLCHVADWGAVSDWDIKGWAETNPFLNARTFRPRNQTKRKEFYPHLSAEKQSKGSSSRTIGQTSVRILG